MHARVTVTLKTGVLDPQGKAIENALASMGIGGIVGVRQGKLFDLEIDGQDRAAAEATVRQACERLLANAVIESFAVRLEEGPGTSFDEPMQAAARHAEMPPEGHP